MGCFIYGAGQYGRKLRQRLQAVAPVQQVDGFYDNFKTGSCDGLPVLPWQQAERTNRVIISVQDVWQMVDIYHQLYDAGFQDLWWYREESDAPTPMALPDCLHDLQGWGEAVLPQAEMHLSDACNLNCAGCTHFSPLYEKTDVDFAQQIADVRQLAAKFSHIVYFYLLGGEPLLNPRLADYVTAVREILPTTELQVVTNGLLLLRLPEKVLQVIHACDCKVSISEYEPTHKLIDQIITRLQQYGIRYGIRPYDAKQVFNKPLTLAKQSKRPRKCISQGCVNIYHGQICRCPTLMYIDKFNQTFNVQLPRTGIMSLADCGAGRELLQKLRQPVPLCQYCVENPVHWSRCQGQPALTDFASHD